MNKTYLKNIRVYSSETESFVPAAIVLRGKRIESVGNVSMPLDACPVDGEGCYVVPGMIDCHTHLSLDCRIPNYLECMNGSEESLRAIALGTLPVDLRSGVTTQRCMGDRFYIDVDCKARIERGELAGPKLFVSGIGMRAPSGTGYVGVPVGGNALTAMILQNVAHGADWIKFYETATVCCDREPVGFYSREEIARIIHTAHEAGKPVTAHCIGGRGLRESVEQGIDCIEHAYYATPEELAMMEDAGTWLCVTAGEYFTDKENASPRYAQQMHATRPRVLKSMRAIMASDIPLVFGTDGLHGRLWEEARYAVEFGASPARVLYGLTEGAARLLGMEHEIGRIAPGYQADLVLLRRNPLEDITALRDVVQVYQNGRSILPLQENALIGRCQEL